MTVGDWHVPRHGGVGCIRLYARMRRARIKSIINYRQSKSFILSRMTKKKNTGVEEINQGHRAKMNSSDRFGLEEDAAEGWTTVLSKRSKKKLRKEKTVEHCQKKGSRSRRGARHPCIDNVSLPRCEDAEVSQDERTPSEQRDSEHEEHQAAEQEQDVKRDEAETNEDACKAPAREKSSEKTSAMKRRKEEMDVDAAPRDIMRHSRPCPLRDVDPSVCAPDPKVIKQIVEMLRGDPSLIPEVSLGVPSTNRRERALKRLKNALSIKYLEAEKLLTSSALAHTYGKECFVHALAMGRYIRNGDSAEDTAEMQRVYLREKLRHYGYNATQVNLALQELSASGTSPPLRCRAGSLRKRPLTIGNKPKLTLKLHRQAPAKLGVHLAKLPPRLRAPFSANSLKGPKLLVQTRTKVS
jgi:hypothetical protein